MRLLILELGHSAGTETVVARVAPEIARRCEAVILAAPRHRQPNYSMVTAEPNVSFVPLEWPAQGWRRMMSLFANRAHRLNLKAIGRLMLGQRIADVIRSSAVTHVFVPCIFDLPTVGISRPVGVMAMDLAWHHFPEGFPGRTRHYLDTRFSAWLEIAQLIFPVSDASSDEIAKAFPKVRYKLRPVPHGASVRPLVDWRTEEPPTFFCPASITANKNHLVLLQAARRLALAGHRFRLVLTGRDTAALKSNATHPRPVVERLRCYLQGEGAILSDRVVAPGYVSDTELERLFASARRVVLPSSYEGFGLPLLEAFERGVPVICSGIAPFREQIARYQMTSLVTVVDPMDEATLATCMEHALHDGRQVPLDAESHQRRLGAWTWDDAAAAYVRHLSELAR